MSGCPLYISWHIIKFSFVAGGYISWTKESSANVSGIRMPDSKLPEWPHQKSDYLVSTEMVMGLTQIW